MIRINGKIFRCDCGCNVFREVAKALVVKKGREIRMTTFGPMTLML